MFAKFAKKKMYQMMAGEIPETQSNFISPKEVEDQDFVAFRDGDLPVAERVQKLIDDLTIEEKIKLLGGYKAMGIHPIPRLGLPSVWCSDATPGLRCFSGGTAFPGGLTMAATWNPELIETVAATIAEEFRAKGVKILLGPGINIYRVPTCGRNFEYMGEDPFLAGKMSAAYIRGAQSKGVATTIKHFACNNSDYDRHKTDSVVDERTLREIYLPAFKIAVQEGGTIGLMSSYNPVNGTYASENRHLLTEILREEWGFEGFVVSDWVSVYSTVGPIKNGLDLEMPNGAWINEEKVIPLLQDGVLTEKDIETPLRRLLTAFFKAGFYDTPHIDPTAEIHTPEHVALAEKAAVDGMVLLKNKGNILPLNPKENKHVVVMGRTALDTTSGGGGSSFIKSDSKIDIVTGLALEIPEVTLEQVPYRNHRLTASEKAIIEKADAVILCAGFTTWEESECYDRTWELPEKQAILIRKVAALNPNTIVVLSAGGGLETESWVHEVPAVLHSLYLGETVGTAVAKVLFGKAAPGGKLPFTMAKRWQDFASTQYYVSKPDAFDLRRVGGPQGGQGNPNKRAVWKMEYEEGLEVGYRHFDSARIEPQFPFGYGLTYTTFELSDGKISLSRSKDIVAKVSVTVTNTGDRAGAEVVQLYLHDVDASVFRPDKELKGFKKVYLEPGKSEKVEFSIEEKHLQFFDVESNSWVAEQGLFDALVGTSSRDIAFNLRFELK
ncbi:MAG: glycoside hydrolase family 3 C-terminal domain-containing protein [Anaerolineae bacterium]|jgi:beta-glucosidase|nr:glycoside hydrolase family 3 C-terminal domain-containing protein [Anaerolineae bacterium]